LFYDFVIILYQVVFGVNRFSCDNTMKQSLWEFFGQAIIQRNYEHMQN